MFRRLLCRWFGLTDPRDAVAVAPTQAVEMEPLQPQELTALVVAATEHPGLKYLLAAFHNHRVGYEHERDGMINGMAAKIDAEAFVRRLCWIDGALAENRWIERQTEIAQRQFLNQVSDAPASD